jgi:hypothetical protein
MRRWIKRSLIVLSIFVAPPLGLYFYTSWRAERELAEVLAELDANEAPWRWDDVMIVKPKAEDEAVRTTIESAHRLMPARFLDRIQKKVEDREMPWRLLTAHDAEIYAAELEAAAPAIREARKLAVSPKGQFRTLPSIEQPFEVSDDLHHCRQLALMLQYDAIWRAHLGELDAAMDDFLAIVRLGRTLDEEASMQAQRLRIMLQSSIALWSLESTLALGQAPPHQLELLQRALDELDPETAVKIGLRGERARVHQLFESLAAASDSLANHVAPAKGGALWNEAVQRLHLRAKVKDLHVWSLRHLTAALKILDAPERERQVRIRALQEHEKEMPAPIGWTGHSVMLTTHQWGEVRRRCAIAALACERFRRKHERWPKTLGELCPEFLTGVPRDPCADLPLQLRPTTNGVVVYSVGPEGKLHGAAYDVTPPNHYERLYEFRLWDVPFRRQSNRR